MTNSQEIIQKIDNVSDKLNQNVYQVNDIWVHDVVFTWRWWIGLLLTIMPWILWIFFRKKESTDRFLYIAFIIILLCVLLDVTGDQYGIWRYRFNLVPIVPTYFPWDFTLMPVTIISLMQFQPKLSPIIKAIVFSLGTSFIGEPLFQWIDVYEPIHWKYEYSVPIQFCIYLLCHWIYQKRFYVEK
ncbi:hypothetical protein PU629_02950 [Pullulanibacillus sp. KACC 23026]|uniref:CBO0543 family protein n=1 Tax=Pullulanibacillus sp. KACC 23026 TaxID=3028315 RepID=UPI0023B1C0F2|nr:CBO0543 family protein [Pullulanibacillus sp. KACC 23026]WEG13339.1 hypothetical protein PU629_02950 [Pullulanibacillus sp. KACC 23026]